MKRYNKIYIAIIGIIFFSIVVAMKVVKSNNYEVKNESIVGVKLLKPFSTGIVNEIITDVYYEDGRGLGNQYYNVSAKYKGNDIYVAVPNDGLYIKKNGNDFFEKIYDGIITLGTMEESYLYFYDYTNESTLGIIALNLDTYDIVMAYKIDKPDIYDYHEMMAENKQLFVVRSDEVICFSVNDNGTLTEKAIRHGENNCYLSPIIVKETGLENNVCFNDVNESLVGNLTFIAKNQEEIVLNEVTDIMITPTVIVGRKSKTYNNIYAWSLIDGMQITLYQADLFDDCNCSYNTYDENGIYGVVRKGDLYSIVQITWDGKYKELVKIEGDAVTIYLDVKLSAIEGWLYFYDSSQSKMKRINIDNPSIIEQIN